MAGSAEMKKKRFPLQQGDLDYLCNLYAIINAMKLMEPTLSIEDAGKIFNFVVYDTCFAVGGNLGAIAAGIGPYYNEEKPDDPGLGNAMKRLLKNVLKTPDLSVGLPQFEIEVNTKVNLRMIAGQIKKTGRPVIFQYRTTTRGGLSREEQFEHCTVVQAVACDGALVLFDSYGLKRAHHFGKDETVDDEQIMVRNAFFLTMNSS
jgi:hypothetical protein